METFSIADGLPSDLILDLAQDGAGRLWIATRSGVAVYDGRELRSLSRADGLPVQVYQALAVDHRGRPWTVTRNVPRVFYQDGPTWRSLPEPFPPLSGVLTSSLAVFDHGGGPLVAVGTTGLGLAVWDAEGWLRLGTAQGLPADYVTSLASRGEKLFVGTAAGLCELVERVPDCRIRESDPRLRGEILALHRAARASGTAARLWILGPTWLGYLEGGRLRVAADDFAIHGFDPVLLGAISVDRAGGVYFGSPSDAYFLDPVDGRTSRLGLMDGLASEGLTAVFGDREGNVWIGSLQGLSKIETRRFLSLDREQGLLDPEVSALAESVPGRYLLGHDNGLTFFDDGRVETVSFDRPATLPIDAYRVLDMAVDGRGEVWVAAESRGLLHLRTDGSWTEHHPAGTIYAVELDREGRLWVLGWRELFVREGDEFARIDLGLAEPPPLRWLTAGSDGRLYLATSTTGLWWRDGESWQRACGPNAAANNVYNVLAEPSGEVWAGTAAGLFELRGRELVAVRRGALAIDVPVYLLLKDPRGRTWFGTDDGVRLWDGERLRHLSYRHGLAGREVNRGAGLVDHAGRVWIGTDRGVSIYQELYDAPPAVAPGVEIRAVEVDGDHRSADGDLHLSHRQRSLTFHVGTIALSREEEVLCRYRLDGFDDVWQGPLPVPATGIRYTNVPPGSYRFRIAAGWGEGPWSDEVVSGALVIDRPLWSEPWFLLLAAVVVVTVVAGGYRLRTRAVRARTAELEALNALLNDALAERHALIAELESFTYTVSHDLKSPLFTIKGFLGFLERDAAAGDAERLAGDVRYIGEAVDKMQRLIEDLLKLSRVGRQMNPPEEVAMGALVVEAAGLLAGPIAERGVKLSVAPQLAVVRGDRTRLLELVQNLLDNAVKYMGAEPAPRVEVGTRRDGGETVFYVRDNGVGIDPRHHEKIFGLFQRLDAETAGTGIGLALVKRIVEVHGGRIWVESEGPGRGATFCFTLPGPSEPCVKTTEDR
ncbi:MAG: hypothetical protein GY856_23015 [bacterium]|nr:hypothetical protein [bacterium]